MSSRTPMSGIPPRADLKVGEQVVLRHGPFRSLWRVLKIDEHGAQLIYAGEVEMIGFNDVLKAPDGTQLTDASMYEFVGKVHLPSLERYVDWPGNVEPTVTLKVERRRS